MKQVVRARDQLQAAQADHLQHIAELSEKNKYLEVIQLSTVLCSRLLKIGVMTAYLVMHIDFQDSFVVVFYFFLMISTLASRK
jgi:hypothetical protein